MKVTIFPGPLQGDLAAIPSKSQAHRLLICAALAEGPTRIVCPELSDDILATAACLVALGAQVTGDSEGFGVTPGPVKPSPLLPCGESGSTYRFMLPLAAALGAEASFSLGGRLPLRPMEALMAEMSRHGVSFSGQGSDRVAIRGRMRGGRFTLPGDLTSQFITGLLLAGPLMPEGCDIALTSPLASGGYVDITREAMGRFGVSVEGLRVRPGQRYRSPGSVSVEGDWSNAAFWLCAGACGGQISLRGLAPDSPQGDRAMLPILARFGARVRAAADEIQVCRPAEPLKAAAIDIADCPDLAPAIALLATQAEGTTRLEGISRLRLKESDRAESITATLGALGAQTGIEGDCLLIRGGAPLQGGEVDGCRDHRIVMMAAIAAGVSKGPVTIRGAEAVGKSYPRFFQDLARLGARITIEN
ncbi:MAG: 3-phosphoshikimate 1-carboxyvinyltransferase [Christensenellales bacterium]